MAKFYEIQTLQAKMAQNLIFLRVNRKISILIFLLGVFLYPQPTFSANWVEISSRGFYYNSDYTFVDRQSGYVAVETTESISSGDGSFFYQLSAIDCGRWNVIVVAAREENKSYLVFANWRNRSDLRKVLNRGTYIDDVARQVCPNRNRLPVNSLP